MTTADWSLWTDIALRNQAERYHLLADQPDIAAARRERFRWAANELNTELARRRLKGAP